MVIFLSVAVRRLVCLLPSIPVGRLSGARVLSPLWTLRAVTAFPFAL